MWSFFHGWRRKAGVVTLVMALALLIIWWRSQSTLDHIRFWYLRQHEISCFEGQIVWKSWDEDQKPSWYVATIPRDDLRLDFLPDWDRNPRDWRAEMWQFVLPLTLAGVYLILGKPRKSKSSNQPAISNLISN